MSTVSDLKHEIQKIHSRNKRVEDDKAWETSKTRKILIVILTYVVIVIFLIVTNANAPFINAIIPSLAFVVSTLTVPIVKKWWIKKMR